MSEELKITKEKIKKIHDGLSSCSEAQDAIKDAFPEAFDEYLKEKWVDITEEVVWKICRFTDGECWLMGTYGEEACGDGQFYLNRAGLHFNNAKAEGDFKFEPCVDDAFRIFKKEY